jgi:DNA repair exonuclease SbcCD ATPase subunit
MDIGKRISIYWHSKKDIEEEGYSSTEEELDASLEYSRKLEKEIARLTDEHRCCHFCGTPLDEEDDCPEC